MSSGTARHQECGVRPPANDESSYHFLNLTAGLWRSAHSRNGKHRNRTAAAGAELQIAHCGCMREQSHICNNLLERGSLKCDCIPLRTGAGRCKLSR
jgi:hypothetical protein